MAYSSGTHQFHSRTGSAASADLLPKDLARAVTGNRVMECRSGLMMLALCEVIEHPSLDSRHGNHDGGILVAREEKTVMTRFFLVYPSGCDNAVSMTTELAGKIQALMSTFPIGHSVDDCHGRSPKTQKVGGGDSV